MEPPISCIIRARARAVGAADSLDAVFGRAQVASGAAMLAGSVLGGVVALEIWLYVVGLAIVGAAEIEGMRLGFRRRDLVPITPAPDAGGPA